MDLAKFNLNRLRTELWSCHILSEQRCLHKACEWASDLLLSLPDEDEDRILTKLDRQLNDFNFDSSYEHAKACFQLHEYDRAAYILRDVMHDDRARFLHYFSKYKAAEKKRVDLMNDVNVGLPKKAYLKYIELRDSLERSITDREPDGWLLYVYALILSKFRLRHKALKELEKSINLSPINWSAWFFLTTIIDNKEQLYELNLPNHLFKVFFYYRVRLDLEIGPKEPWVMVGARETRNFLDKFFEDSLFIKTLSAKSMAYQSNNYEAAIKLFSEIRRQDPYRVDAMEVFSNLLYVKKMTKELANLAYDIERVDPFTPEANSCIANSFSAREQHSKAILYFTRALRINPDNQNSWSLIGHEYLEMKSIDKAHQAYLNALSSNKRDIRAWIGLGNTFETIMSSPNHPNPNYERCLYYYSQVGKFKRKHDIMFLAMGSIFEKMGSTDLAIITTKQAGQSGLERLAKLYESKGKQKEAAEVYAQINALRDDEDYDEDEDEDDVDIYDDDDDDN